MVLTLKLGSFLVYKSFSFLVKASLDVHNFTWVHAN